MNVQELFLSTNSNLLAETFIQKYEDYATFKDDASCMEKAKNKILKTINQITKINPKYNDSRLAFCIALEDEGKTTYDVGCILKTDIEKITPENNLTYDLVCIPWDEVAGMEVCQVSLDMYGKVTTAAEILYCITFFGYSLKEVEKNYKEFEEMLRNIGERITSCKTLCESMSDDNADMFFDVEDDDDLCVSEELKAEIDKNMKTVRKFWDKVRNH